MRNLALTRCEAIADDVKEIKDAQYISVDPDSNIAYIASDSQLTAFNYETKEVVNSVTLTVRDPNIGFSPTPIGLQYLYDSQAVCVATQDGQIFLWSANSTELECVGEVEHGLLTMSWSPGLDVFIIITTNKTMILMTSEFDPFSEVVLFPDCVGEENPVSVGWGKKETQFHGSAGKDAAKHQTVTLEPAGPNDIGCFSVRWRGDGCFFVISAIDPTSGARSLYTWSRECVFQAKSEPVTGLQHQVFWKPSGSIIASVQRKGKGSLQDVIFFEKNGLRHGNFSIPDSTDESVVVHSLKWNSSSTILLLWINKVFEDGEIGYSEVHLWTVNNYHWYLKQCLKFESRLSAVEWDPYDASTLHIFTRRGAYVKYTWTSSVNCTSGSNAEDLATVAVIDGEQLLMTPMRNQVVPPPMAAFSLSLHAPVNYVTFHPSSNDLAAVLADETIVLFSYKVPCKDVDVLSKAACGSDFACKVIIPTLSCTLRSLESSTHYALDKSHYLWISDKKMFYVTCDMASQSSVLNIADMNLADSLLTSRFIFPMDSLVIAVARNESCSRVAIHLVTGEIFCLDIELETVQPWETSSGNALTFPVPCPQMAVGKMGNEEAVLGLTERHRFFINDVDASSLCTSFALHNDFLLVSTINHTLHCVSRSTKLQELSKIFEGKTNPLDERLRKTERGTQIVCVVGDDTKLVLQMPRGNLETINPRALVLRTFQKLMDSNQIMNAFVLLRKNRINTNLLYDHDPTTFMACIDDFIKQINNTNHLNLFITDLKEEDVTKTMYPASYEKLKTVEDVSMEMSSGSSKINTVCNALLASFYRLGKDRYILSILAAHVKKTKPEIEKALLLVWSIFKVEYREAPNVLVALNYLLFLVDVNTLYDVALGTYNFDLVMMVAAQSQKDPKEYIPYLNRMRRLEENHRKFSIDCHLKRFNSALEHAAKCGDVLFEEALEIVAEHKLYRKALSVFKVPTHYKRIASSYGAYLKSKNRQDEAGIMYMKAADWETALDCFRTAGDWKQVLCMAAKLGYSRNQFIDLANKLAADMRSSNRHLDASRLYEEYAEDPEEAMAVLIEGGLWSDALILINRHHRSDLIETHLLDALKENADQQLEFLTGQKEQFDNYFRRLAIVRIEKEKQYINFLEGIADGHGAEADLFSDTSSVTDASVTTHRTFDSSRSTVFSKATGSSRSRRKQEGKKWSLKEGSANEEFALIDALAKVMRCVDGLRGEVNSLMKYLIQFDFDDTASDLQNFYSDFLTKIQSSVDKIWIRKENTEASTLGPGTTANAIAQAMQRGQARPQAGEEKDPVLVVPPKLNKDVRWKLHIAGDLDK